MWWFLLLSTLFFQGLHYMNECLSLDIHKEWQTCDIPVSSVNWLKRWPSKFKQELLPPQTRDHVLWAVWATLTDFSAMLSALGQRYTRRPRVSFHRLGEAAWVALHFRNRGCWRRSPRRAALRTPGRKPSRTRQEAGQGHWNS